MVRELYRWEAKISFLKKPRQNARRSDQRDWPPQTAELAASITDNAPVLETHGSGDRGGGRDPATGSRSRSGPPIS
jgi:hypothetical protein